MTFIDYNSGTSTAVLDYGNCDNSTSGWAKVHSNVGYKKVVFNCAITGEDDYGCEVYRTTPYRITSDASTQTMRCKDYYRAVVEWGNTECTTNYFEWKLGYKSAHYPQKTPQERLREIIASRQSPLILVSRKPIEAVQDIREIRARETLCRVLGEDKYQKFLKDGFVSVRAKSGLIYQIFPGHGITAVYRDGVQVERLCVVLRGDFPPTDSLIMRYLIILNDESRFRGYAVKHQVIVKQPQKAADERPLVEIYRELKEGRKVA